jgi:hypothetical protein
VVSKSWWDAGTKNVGLHPVVPKILRPLVATGEQQPHVRQK